MTPPVDQPGLTVFVVRREAIASGLSGELVVALEACGFELLRTIDLNPDQIGAVASIARGDNWDRGGLPVDGGPPAQAIVAFDVFPSTPTADERRRYPTLDNQHTLHAKMRCHELIRERIPRDRWFNPVYGTYNSDEAWKFVRRFVPAEEPGLRALTESRRATFATSHDVVRDLTRGGYRAKIELIRFADGLAVKKTFRENCLKYFEREVGFLEAMSPHRPEILPVLERGPNYFVTPFVDGSPLRASFLGRNIPRLMTLQQVGDAADLLFFLFSHGYDPIDLSPHNLIVDRTGGLTAIDFEFVHRRPGPVTPELSGCLHGMSEYAEGEWPRSRMLRTDPYYRRWFPHTALPLRSFLYDPAWLQALKRAAYYPAYLVFAAIRHQVRRIRERGRAPLERYLL